jgi:hypothetical protein
MLVDAAEGGKERVLPLALPKIFRVAEPSLVGLSIILTWGNRFTCARTGCPTHSCSRK